MDREPTTAELDSPASPRMSERLASWAAHTLDRGAGTDETPDPEPWDDAAGDPRSGEEGVGAASFMPDIGGPVPVGEADPVAVVKRVPVLVGRPSVWRTSGEITLNETAAVLVAPERPERAAVLVTNTHATATAYLGPNESGCVRPLAAGESWTAEHTAEVWAVGDGVTVIVDETAFRR